MKVSKTPKKDEAAEHASTFEIRTRGAKVVLRVELELPIATARRMLKALREVVRTGRDSG